MAGAALPAVDWYFDVLSPYAYFASVRLDEVEARATVRLRPVVFAAVLNHWGQKGPAEIPGKREAAYRWCEWTAQQRGIDFRMPAVHPFNPIAWLRLIVAAGCSSAAVHAVFQALWTTGQDPSDADLLASTAATLGLSTEQLSKPAVKQALHDSTDAAIAAGVFGVPTLRLHRRLFWGEDAMDFAVACLDDPGILDTPAMRRVDELPVGVARRQS